MAGRTGTGGVYRTRDGGRTWEPITGVGSEWGGYGVETALVGRDGRLYVATYGGVWRTSEPLPVAAEAEPPEASGARLRVEPNPASGAVTIRLTLATPEAEVRVSVFDARGREVAVVASGARGAGVHVFAVDTVVSGGGRVRGARDGGRRECCKRPVYGSTLRRSIRAARA